MKSQDNVVDATILFAQAGPFPVGSAVSILSLNQNGLVVHSAGQSRDVEIAVEQQSHAATPGAPYMDVTSALRGGMPLELLQYTRIVRTQRVSLHVSLLSPCNPGVDFGGQRRRRYESNFELAARGFFDGCPGHVAGTVCDHVLWGGSADLGATKV